MFDSQAPSLIRAMLRPEFYPHPTSDRIRLLQTHISYVLLTGDYAYKVKKPVDLGFLDFSTLDRRRHFCSEELRLNRRGAPGLYLGVVPVSQDGDHFQLGGAGEPVEYAVKMRQFAQDSLCRAMLEQGVLTDTHVLSLAATVARYHAGAATDGHISSFGTPQRLRDGLEQNYRATERFVGGPQTRLQFDETSGFTERFLREREDLLLARVRGGHVRECHGDLHLNNISFWEGSILLFDCVEFSEALRFVDTAYDTAFTAMDLEARGRPDLANLFLNTYAEQTGDWEGFRVLPLYLCRQAYVRAKVSSILAEEVAGDQTASDRAMEEAAVYYRLAWHYARPRLGRILLMCGLSGAGKSTVARALAKRVGAIHIRSDAVRKHLAGIPLDARGGAQIYGEETTRRTYDRLLHLAGTLASEGYAVILDAKFDQAALRAAALNAASRCRLPAHILHCSAQHGVLRERLRSRTGDVSDAHAGLVDEQERKWEGFTEAERPAVITLDTTGPRPADAIAEEAVRRLHLAPP
jgi:aminoglycoside phosphotransferase family enzyme/predicted kinase